MKDVWRYYQITGNESSSEKNWAESIREIGSVKSVPELLYTLDKVESVGLLNLIDLNFFKSNLKPVWEDPANINGGRCILDIPLSQKNNIFEYWKKTVAFCYSGIFPSIAGCVFAEKANFRISIWITESQDSFEIISMWKKILNSGGVCLFEFRPHNKNYDHGFQRKRYVNKNKF